MIIKWQYNNSCDQQQYIKNYILKNQYTCIDIGASMRFWSYPECKFAADIFTLSKEDITFFQINLEDQSTWTKLLEYVFLNGKFDFSICSHTLEDIFNPLNLIILLTNISHRGFVAVPSKYDEFSFLFQNKYRGNAHHKQFFDIINDELIVFPKFSWIEKDSRSDNILTYDKGKELSFLWEKNIPIKIFGEGIPCRSDDELINNFYQKIIN
jgi:hypothetical protein